MEGDPLSRRFDNNFKNNKRIGVALLFAPELTMFL